MSGARLIDMLQDAGKLLLASNTLEFNGSKLQVREEGAAAPPKKPGKAEAPSSTMFVPRGARPRAGLGSSKKPSAVASASSTGAKTRSSASSAKPGAGKSQDDFRKLL